MASYTGQIKTNGKWVNVETATGVTFENGKTYNMQIQNSAYLKIGRAAFYYNNEKFDYKDTGSNLFIKTENIPCVLSILESDSVESDDVPVEEPVSYDSATKTITLSNAYVVDGINNMTDEQTKESLLQIIGNDDLEISLENVVDLGGGMEGFASDLTITEGVPFGNILTTSGGSYNIVFGTGVMIVNSDYLTLAGATLDTFTQMGGYVSDDVLTITEDSGVYYVQFN